MKTTISFFVLLICMVMYLPAQNIVDDIYFRPSDANKALTTEKFKSEKPNYKNGAKEIIYIDTKKNKSLIFDKDTLYLLSEMNDSISIAEGNDSIDEEGYYVGDFKGGKTEYEYAERIRRFHNPKFTIHISDPQYTDIYFLDDNNWNVYVDGSYAWVTPTWTNPFWDNYFWRPYSYSSWYWRNSWYGSPYAYYNSWNHGYPWSYGGYYSGYYGGWGSYYNPGYYGGWGYPSYYGNYWNHYSNWGYTTTSRNKNYNEANRRKEYYSGSRGGSGSSSVNTRIAGGNYSPAISRGSVVTNERQRITGEVVTRSTDSRNTVRGTTNINNLNSRTSNTIRNTGINTRTRTVDNSGLYNRDSRMPATIIRDNNTVSRSASETVVNRTTQTTRTTPAATVNRSSSTVRTGTGTSTVRSTTTPARSESSSSPYVSTPSVRSSTSSGTQTYSTPSYSSPSTTTRSSSGSSYSGSSTSSGGSRSSGGSSSGGRR